MMSNRTYTIAVATAITVRMIFAIDTVMKTTAAANRSRTHKLVRAKSWCNVIEISSTPGRLYHTGRNIILLVPDDSDCDVIGHLLLSLC
jgi:hypothetical protein